MEDWAVTPRRKAIDWMGKMSMSSGKNSTSSYWLRPICLDSFQESGERKNSHAYQLQRDLLDDYLIQQLKNPSLMK